MHPSSTRLSPLHAQRSAVEEGGGFARVRAHGLDLQLEVADLRARIAQLRSQPRVLLLEASDLRVLSTMRPVSVVIYKSLLGEERLTSCEVDSERVGSMRGAGVIGEGASSSRMTGAGAGAAAGGGAEVVLVGAGVGTEIGAEPAEIEPSSSETSLGAAVLPEKNSAAERAGSAEGAGGKMSDWKESDCGMVSICAETGWNMGRCVDALFGER